MLSNCQILDPPYFSIPTTFTDVLKKLDARYLVAARANPDVEAVARMLEATSLICGQYEVIFWPVD
jgi:hypothetical protein